MKLCIIVASVALMLVAGAGKAEEDHESGNHFWKVCKEGTHWYMWCLGITTGFSVGTGPQSMWV